MKKFRGPRSQQRDIPSSSECFELLCFFFPTKYQSHSLSSSLPSWTLQLQRWHLSGAGTQRNHDPDSLISSSKDTVFLSRVSKVKVFPEIWETHGRICEDRRQLCVNSSTTWKYKLYSKSIFQLDAKLINPNCKTSLLEEFKTVQVLAINTWQFHSN